MAEQTAISIAALMDQAQVFASAWSLVDGQFDQGDQLEVANDEKARLKEMLEEFQEQIYANAAPGNLKEIAEGLIAWHKGRMQNIHAVLDAPADTEIRLGAGDDPIVLAGEKLKGFRVGMIIAQQWFEQFPLSISRNASDEED